MMLRLVCALALASYVSAASLQKKDSYGGSTYSSNAAPGTYDASNSYAQQPSYAASGQDQYGQTTYGQSAVSYGSAPSYGNSYSGNSYGASGDNYGAQPAQGGNSADSYGNLYYYYYPVTNASQTYQGGYSAGGNAQAGGYYGPPSGPVAPPAPSSDPLSGLLSVVGAVDLNSLILPALLIGGVALLLPALLNCDLELGTCVIPIPFAQNGQAGAGTRRRRAADDIDMSLTIPQAIDHAYRIYDAVHESEQCMQRVVCELGGMLRNLRGKEAFFTILEHFASPSIKKQLFVLKQGALSAINASRCEKFNCGKLDNNKID